MINPIFVDYKMELNGTSRDLVKRCWDLDFRSFEIIGCEIGWYSRTFWLLQSLGSGWSIWSRLRFQVRISNGLDTPIGTCISTSSGFRIFGFIGQQRYAIIEIIF